VLFDGSIENIGRRNTDRVVPCGSVS